MSLYYHDVMMSSSLPSPVDPEEIHLPEAAHHRAQFLGPTVLAVRARQLGLGSGSVRVIRSELLAELSDNVRSFPELNEKSHPPYCSVKCQVSSVQCPVSSVQCLHRTVCIIHCAVSEQCPLSSL